MKYATRSGVALLVLLAACRRAPPESKPATDIFAALGEPLPSLNAQQRASFLRGRQVALRRWTPSTGLGTLFNVTRCAACHEKPVPGGRAGRTRNFLMVGTPVPFGGQVPNISFSPVGVHGVQPLYSLMNEPRFPTEIFATIFGLRSPVPLFGVGLLAEIPEDAILKNSDERDDNADGISGRPNRDLQGHVARFGRKANLVSLEPFARDALFDQMGVTRQQAGAPADERASDFDSVPDPEFGGTELADLLAFAGGLAVPAPGPETAEVAHGRELFARIRCDACHVPTLDAPRGSLPLYSDLLLHDMGLELADGVSLGLATDKEYRTQPLWGIAAAGPYLHDGRADTLEDAIVAHGGEGEGARRAFVALPAADRQALLAFLNNLGGAAEHSDGLLPPSAPVPAPGEPGGPARSLTAEEGALFETGRRMFDRDVETTAGLGPFFDGDSCRGCHGIPTIGGSGALDTDVFLHGIWTDAGNGPVFTVPSIGIATHRQATANRRPPFDDKSTWVENRQAPALFGLGAIEGIADADILLRDDPDDLDHDGISGRAHRLPDGRVGRFGWKAATAAVPDAVRSELSGHMGLTVPGANGSAAVPDVDDVADPEVDASTIDGLVFFLRLLAPPLSPGLPGAADEAAGAALFVQVGCGKCHVPSLPGPGGVPVAAYSDLLLHDVAPAGFPGIPEGAALAREFRTPPLWGLAASAPYLHDGRAETVEAAITAHAGEATAIRDAFAALDTDARALLLHWLAAR